MRFVRSALVLTVAAAILLGGCSPQAKSTQQNQTQPSFVTHTVQNSGETLASIAKWYTGASSNWHALQDANPGLDPRKIRIGTTIQIPRELASRTDAPPRPKASTVAKKTSASDSMPGTSNSVDTQDSFAAENAAPGSDSQVVAEVPMPPSDTDTTIAAANDPYQGEPVLATDDAVALTSDRASPEIAVDAPVADPSALNANTALENPGSIPPSADAGFEGAPPAPPSGGLVKGILEAVGNASLDAQREGKPAN